MQWARSTAVVGPISLAPLEIHLMCIIQRRHLEISVKQIRESVPCNILKLFNFQMIRAQTNAKVARVNKERALRRTAGGRFERAFIGIHTMNGARPKGVRGPWMDGKVQDVL